MNKVNDTELFQTETRISRYLLSCQILRIQNMSEKCVAGVVVAFDGSHIPIIASKNNPASYINRKGFHSVNRQYVMIEKTS